MMSPEWQYDRIQARPVLRPGLTLIELVVSIAITSVLMVAISASILIASRAVPDDEQPQARLIETTGVSERIVSELYQAVHVISHSATSMAFTVADRDGDGSPERISYAWSGIAGAPLLRGYNGAAAVVILKNVRQFSLSYDLKTVIEEYPGPLVEGAEQLLSVYDGAVALKDYKIDANDWIGQHFRPTMPAGAISWSVTRVRFQAMIDGHATESTLVQLRTINTDYTPTATVLEEKTMLESGLTSSYTWREFAFGDVAGLFPGQGLSLVLQHVAGKASANIQYEDAASSGCLRTADAGSSWEFRPQETLKHKVFGRITTAGPAQTASRDYIAAVRLTIRAGDEQDTRIDTSVRLFNAPEVLSAAWETDFDSDPTILDFNGDGSGDWVRTDGQAFDTGTLGGGIWNADAALKVYPDNDLVGLTTAKVRFRNTSVGGKGAVLWLNLDWSGGTFATLLGCLQLQADGTQTLTVYSKQDSLTEVPLVTVKGLTGGFVTLRLLTDTALNTVNVKVDGKDRGTYVYYKYVPSGDSHFAGVLPWGSNAEFDYISIRAGGT